ncbi:Fumarate hydratase class I, partial [hydrothermal vent metagenome]
MPNCNFHYAPVFQSGPDTTSYRRLTNNYVKTIEAAGRRILTVDPEALRLLAREALRDISFLLRRNHLRQLASIIDDPAASGNDRYVAATLLKNAREAAKGILPGCQDTGTAIIHAHKGEQVWTNCDDRQYLSQGIFDTYTSENLRYSQMAPLSMFEEVNTQCNLPAQIDIYARPGNEYHFLFLAKGGGSANKT